MTNREPFRFIQQYKLFFLFCVAYMLGLLAGLLFIVRYPVASLMRLLNYPQMSIVIGFLVSAMPFVVFYIVFRYSAFFPVPLLAFVRAFSFMYCFAGVSLAYADAGWLVRCLLLFTDCFSAPMLIWYVGGMLLDRRASKSIKLWQCLLLLVAIRCIDCSVISPFASKLLLF